MNEVAPDAKVSPGPEIKRFRRIITGHDAQGRSIILSDATSPHVMPIMEQPNFAVTDFWKTFATPADNGAAAGRDPCAIPTQVAPPAAGSVFRVVQFPPDRDWAAKATALLGVKAVLARSFERIHRSNLVQLGVLPIELSEDLSPTGPVTIEGPFAAHSTVTVRTPDGDIDARVRLDTAQEAEYYRHGGILPYVLRQRLGPRTP